MTDPVLVEVTRGELVESVHRGAYAVCDADGAIVSAVGDLGRPVFPRSAIKALQALPLLESGAADAYAFGPRELALAQASHGGEPAHVERAEAMLAALGLNAEDLECGPQIPSHKSSAAQLVRDGCKPSQLHNNCSGKHINFLAVARHLGIAHRGYVSAHHPVQVAVREVLEQLTGTRHGAEHCGTDGCSIPTYAVPLPALAVAFARFGTGRGLSEQRAAAAARLYKAATSEPYYVAGSGRFCTEVMEVLAGAALVKTGAEGVFCAAVPGRGLGIALKCQDGSTRAAEAIMAAILGRLLPDQEPALRRWTSAPILTRRAAQVGAVRAVPEAFVGIS